MSLKRILKDQTGRFRVDCPHCAEGISFVPAQIEWTPQEDDFAAARATCGACGKTVRLSADGKTGSFSAFEANAHEERRPVAGACVSIDNESWHKNGETCEACGFGLDDFGDGKGYWSEPLASAATNAKQ